MVTALTIAASGLAVVAAPGATALEGTKISMTPLRVTVNPYQTTRHTARLMTSDGRAITGQAIQFWVRPPSSQTWTLYRTQPVDANGYTTVAVAPRDTTYLQARFKGTEYRSSSMSSSALITVGTLGQRVIQEASRHRGKPYQWGASGPHRFDCSGFTMYVWAKFGKRLPHNSAQQYSVVRKIAKSQARPGDLIFTYNSSGRIGHVGIYAGNGTMWAAPHSGAYVRHQRIYTSNYYVGRVA